MLSTSLIRQAFGGYEIQNFFTVGLRDTRINVQKHFVAALILLGVNWCKAKDTAVKLEHCHMVEILISFF